MGDYSDVRGMTVKITFAMGQLFISSVGGVCIFNALKCREALVSDLTLSFGVYNVMVGLFGLLTLILMNRKWMFRVYKLLILLSFGGFIFFATHLFFRLDSDIITERRMLKMSLEGYDLNLFYQKKWDELQQREGCCGIDNYEDWRKYGGFNKLKPAPESCCKINSKGDATNECFQRMTLASFPKEGCFEKVIGFTRRKEIAKIITSLLCGCFVLSWINFIP